MNEPQLTWSIERTDKALRLSYEVNNVLDERIWVCDKIVIAKGRDDYVTTDQPIVKNDRSAPDSIQITLGPISSDRPSTQLFSPTYRVLEAGRSFNDVRTIPLPLRAFHPLGGVDPLKAGAANVIFKLFWFKKEPRWKEYPSKSGAPIKVPDAPLVMILQSSKPMP